MIHRVTVTTCLAVTLSVVSPALAGVPDFVSYSGRLTDGTAWGQSTTLSLTFWLCESPQGDCGWSELHEAVSIEDGYFSVRLGEKEPLPTPLPEGLWITVAVAGGEPLGPREPVGSVPFALQAREVAPSGGESVLKAMKLALGFSDDPADPNYISDERFALNQRNAMTGDCPPDYERDLSGSNVQYVVCRKGQDEMVKVGDFWIDRYEMSGRTRIAPGNPTAARRVASEATNATTTRTDSRTTATGRSRCTRARSRGSGRPGA